MSWQGFLPKNSIVMARISKSLPIIIDTFENITSDLNNCQRCKLCSTRKNIVISEGNPTAKLMLIGEGPAEQDDIQCRPFVGNAGLLMDKMIEAIGLKREEVFICNVIKCRPPENRDPEPDEVQTCAPFVYRQIKLVKPSVILTLGRFAAQTLLKTEEKISHLRGNVFDYEGAKLIPSFHPAYLLRNPDAKKEAWDDLKLVARELGLVIPRRGAGA